MDEQVENDLHSYNTLLTLWQAENPIKTIKLQFLLATNAGFVGVLSLANGNTILLGISGVVLNVVWTLSLGRTSLFQKAWKNKLDEIALRYPTDSRFQILDIKAAEASSPGWLRGLGGISSKYYLLGTPIIFAVAWCFSALQGSN